MDCAASAEQTRLRRPLGEAHLVDLVPKLYGKSKKARSKAVH